MISHLLDASALIAYLRGETGADTVYEVLGASGVSAVNVAEIVAKTVWRGGDGPEALSLIRRLGVELLAFTPEQGAAAGQLFLQTRDIGLFLGDRCCLATAKALGVPVMTADRAWAGLNIGVEIVLIR